MGAIGSSTISWRTSTSSSTSDAIGVRLAGLIRLVHPFPSLLDGLVVAAVALVAGGEPVLAARLGVSMTALQASIGALNDLHDAPTDAGRKPGKPIPAGHVGVPLARSVAVGGAVVGLGLAATVGVTLTILAAAVLAIGYGYDLVAKGTAWSWLPFAVGIPILPVYGWLGAAGSLPAFFGVLAPMAVAAGAALAIANARADVERDVEAGTASIATRLGPGRSWWIHATLWVVVLGLALGWLARERVPLDGWLPVVAAAALLVAGVIAGRRGDAAGRERAWQVEAVAIALALVAWIRAALV
jgi:4-hydroxybenzoate polyprenyltransferase